MRALRRGYFGVSNVYQIYIAQSRKACFQFQTCRWTCAAKAGSLPRTWTRSWRDSVLRGARTIVRSREQRERLLLTQRAVSRPPRDFSFEGLEGLDTVRVSRPFSVSESDDDRQCSELPRRPHIRAFFVVHRVSSDTPHPRPPKKQRSFQRN